MNQVIDLKTGGSVVVMVGNTGWVQEFAYHAQVKFIKCKEIPGDQLVTEVPDNTKVVIVSEGLPDHHYHWIMAYARRKNIPWLLRKSNQAIYDQLKTFFNGNNEVKKPTPEEVKDTQVKGKLTFLTEYIDFNRSNVENARELFKKCQERKIATTMGSLAQFVANKRREGGRTERPKSVRSKLDVSVELLDKMIEDLGAMRDYLIATTEENRILKDKLEKFKKVLE